MPDLRNLIIALLIYFILIHYLILYLYHSYISLYKSMNRILIFKTKVYVVVANTKQQCTDSYVCTLEIFVSVEHIIIMS